VAVGLHPAVDAGGVAADHAVEGDGAAVGLFEAGDLAVFDAEAVPVVLEPLLKQDFLPR
jgi:hypothetical protein